MYPSLCRELLKSVEMTSEIVQGLFRETAPLSSHIHRQHRPPTFYAVFKQVIDEYSRDPCCPLASLNASELFFEKWGPRVRIRSMDQLRDIS